MRYSPKEVEAHLATLRQTPLLIRSVSQGLTESQGRVKVDPDAWSLVEQLAHIHACAEIWGDDIDRMLSLDLPIYAKPHPRKVAQVALRRERPFAEMSRTFVELRARLLETVAPLDPGQWERGATINGRYHTVYTQTRRMALHEAAHAEQIREIWQAIGTVEPSGNA